MCWKDEWEAAIKNLRWAIIHIQRAQDSLEKRALRNRKTLQKLQYPSERKHVEELLKKNTEAVEKCTIMIDTLKKYQAALINLIETHGISRKATQKRQIRKNLTSQVSSTSQWQDWIKPILSYIREKDWTREDEIYKEFQERGVSREDIEAVLAQLVREGAIYTPRVGVYRRTW